MSRRLAIAFLIALAAVAFACGFDAAGSFVSDAPAADASTADDGGITGANDGAPTDAEVDLTDAPPLLKCDGGHYTDPLTTLDTSTWLVVHDSSNGDHPKIDPSAEGPAVSLVLPGAATSLGAIWLQPAIAIKAFDVSFRYQMTCPDAGGCSDGLAAAWLEETDAGPAALQTSTSTATFGLPPGLHGTAVALDVHTDVTPGDPPTPAISFLGLDGSAPGTYDWHTKSTAVPALAGSHDVAIRVRKGNADVKLDGVVVLSGPVSTDFTGWFGIAASSGAELGTFVVRSFDATFYACDDP